MIQGNIDSLHGDYCHLHQTFFIVLLIPCLRFLLLLLLSISINPQSEGNKQRPGPAVRNLRKTQHELGLQLNQPVLLFDALDPATQLTNNTRRMLSRLGVEICDEDDKYGTTTRHSNGGRINEGAAYSKRQQQDQHQQHQHQQQQQNQRQREGEWDDEQQDDGLMEDEVEAGSVAGDGKPCGSCRGGCGGTGFQEELARAFSLAVQADTRLERDMTEIMSRALKESRQRQVMRDA